MYRRYGKRALDFLIGMGVLIVLSPVMLLIALAIYAEDPGPVLFRQKRLGLHGEVFTMLKFRSMKVNSEHTGSGVYSEKGDPRVTKVGRILRATSADELIQAVHLVSGKMSLIGPRPPLTYHPWPLEKYTEEQLHMFDVRPGITGWAQVNGRNAISWEEKFDLDVYYVDHIRFALDVKILIQTVAKVFRREGISAEGSATMEEFTGTR